MHRERPSPSGFTLIEVLVAMAVLAVGAAAAAGLLTRAMRVAVGARSQTSTTLLAMEKLEQLRGLTWAYASATSLVPVTDGTTDLTRDPWGSGGPGLAAGPAGSLDADTPGYVDYLDAAGRWVGTGTSPPPAAVFIRRWSVEALSGHPDAIVLTVLVTTVMREREVAAAGGPRGVHLDDALVVTVRSRKGA